MTTFLEYPPANQHGVTWLRVAQGGGETQDAVVCVDTGGQQAAEVNGHVHIHTHAGVHVKVEGGARTISGVAEATKDSRANERHHVHDTS